MAAKKKNPATLGPIKAIKRIIVGCPVCGKIHTVECFMGGGGVA